MAGGHGCKLAGDVVIAFKWNVVTGKHVCMGLVQSG